MGYIDYLRKYKKGINQMDGRGGEKREEIKVKSISDGTFVKEIDSYSVRILIRRPNAYYGIRN